VIPLLTVAGLPLNTPEAAITENSLQHGDEHPDLCVRPIEHFELTKPAE
jgi:hypothetical protein